MNEGYMSVVDKKGVEKGEARVDNIVDTSDNIETILAEEPIAQKAEFLSEKEIAEREAKLGKEKIGMVKGDGVVSIGPDFTEEKIGSLREKIVKLFHNSKN